MAPKSFSSNQSAPLKLRICMAFLTMLVLTASLCISACADSMSTVHGQGLLITEVMAQNTVTLQDDDGEYSDWIELCNTGDTNITLQGWYLSDNPNVPMQWEFPPVTLTPGEYIVVFASGKNRFDSTQNIYHAGFRISSNGEVLTLYNAELGTVQTLELGRAEADISYGVVMADGGSQYAWLSTPTPGAENTGEYASAINQLPSPADGVVINEYMTANRSVIYDSDGDYCDWVELYNSTGQAVDLSGFTLSDDPSDPEKWEFPEGCIIPADGYLLVFLSGKDIYKEGELHASFRLGSTDTTLSMHDSHTRLIDSVPVADTKNNISAGRTDEGEWKFFAMPTPGAKNPGTSFDAL